MSPANSDEPLASQHQSAGDVTIEGKENAFALVNAAGNATVDQSHHVIIYNYYQSEFKAVAVEVVELADNLPCPYRGLAHFGPDDAEFFFGREVFVAELVGAVQTCAFVPVLGASGSGKSSVVFAGLVPQLQQLGHWQFTYFRPGTDPFHAVASALVPLYTPERNETEQLLQARDLAVALQGGRLPLGDVIARIQRNYPQQRVLLIADQFEELYTLCPEEATRRQFLDCLLASLAPAQPSTLSPLVLVATMRADFLGSALSYRPLADVLQAGDVKLGAMNREELGNVIEKPAVKLGVSFEPGLAKRILDAVDKEPGNLPLLEFALTELWKQRQGRELTHAAYDAIGEVQGALARYADEQYARLQPHDQATARRIFVQLVRPGEGTEDTRRLATKAELGEDRWALVKQLADTRLVVTSQDGGKQETVEVVHEALIRHWGELRGWMEEDRDFRNWQERLRAVMHQWVVTNHDEEGLLRGAALVEADEKFQQYQANLSIAEQTFIQKSIELCDRLKKTEATRQQREITLARRVAIGAIGAAIVLSVFAIFAFVQWNESQKRSILQLAQSARNKFVSNQQLEAMVDAVKAEHQSQQLLFGREEVADQVTGTLIWLTSEIREHNKWRGTQANVVSVAFTSDSQKLVIAGDDGTTKVWDLVGNPIAEITPYQEDVKSISLSSNGQRSAIVKLDGATEVWDITNQKLVTSIQDQREIQYTEFSPDNRYIVTVGLDGKTQIRNLMGKSIGVISKQQEDVSSVTFSPDSQYIATGGKNGTVKLWNLAGRLVTVIGKQQNSIQSIAFSPDGKRIATVEANSIAKIWSVAKKSVLPIYTNQGTIHSLRFSPHGQLLISAGKDGTLKTWDLAGNLINTITTQQGSVLSFAFSPDGQWLVTGGSDGTNKLWDFDQPPTSIATDQGALYTIGFSSNGRWFATGGADGTVKIWDLMGKNITTIFSQRRNIYRVIFDLNKQRLVTLTDDKVELWDLAGNPIAVLASQQKKVTSLAVSPSGNSLATSAEDSSIELWDITGTLPRLVASIDAGQGIVWMIAFSPDGKRLVSGGDDGTAKIWDLTGGLGKPVNVINTKQNFVYRLAFSPNNQQLLTTGKDGNAKLWDLSSSKLIQIIPAQQILIWDIAFSPDGRTFATGGEDGTVKLWDLTGNLAATIDMARGSVGSVAFTSDGQYVASSGATGTVDFSRVSSIHELHQVSCNWLQSYLENPSIDLSDSDKNLCP